MPYLYVKAENVVFRKIKKHLFPFIKKKKLGKKSA